MAMLDAITSSRLQTDLFLLQEHVLLLISQTQNDRKKSLATIATALTAEAGLAENTAITTAEH